MFYYCVFKYAVNPTSQVRNPISTLHELDKTHQECQEIKAFTRAFLQQVTESHHLSIINEGEILFWQVLWKSVTTILKQSAMNRSLIQGVDTAAHLWIMGRLLLTGYASFFFSPRCLYHSVHKTVGSVWRENQHTNMELGRTTKVQHAFWFLAN